MWETSRREVLVAVKSADCHAALRYAADEARRQRCGVHLVHVIPLACEGDPAQAGSLRVANERKHRIGTAVLRESAAALERELRDDDLTVSTQLCHGAVVPAVVAGSIHACLVVVQRRYAGDGEAPALSATDGIAALARAPVVVVPADWRQPSPIRVPVVTVGVDDVDTSAEIVRTAL